MKYFYLLLPLLSLNSYSQDSWGDFTGEEKAFFYHYSRRIEIIEPELFHLFEFTDSIPYINDTLPDHKYVERQIVNNPSKLRLHKDQMSRKSNGLISDLATKFALWELNKVLQYRNSTDDKDKPLKEKLKVFEHYVLENIPQTAVRTISDGSYTMKKGVQGYYTPALALSDKMAGILNSGYSQSDQMLILNAIMRAEEKYVLNRSKEIFEILGGNCEDYRNFLSAAGDGSDWSSLEGSFNTPYTMALSDDKGLFRFEVVEKVNKETEKKFLSVKDILVRELTTRSDRSTTIHFDVYGYHPERQTTIAIQKGGSSYILYGKNEHRLISPDSSYGEGTTYWRLMWELKEIHIADLREDLYGKRGYEYWIDEYEKRIEKSLLSIKQTEFKIDELQRQPNPPKKMKKKKFKKKNLGYSDQDGQGHPTGKMTKLDKQKNIEQNRLIHLNTLLENQKAMLAKLKREMEEAYFRLVEYETLLDKMQKNLGYLFMEYEQEGDIYTFNDGAIYNYATQDFTFPKNGKQESFHIYHISFGKTVFDAKIDENFVHINLSSVIDRNKYVHQKIVKDKFPMTEFSEGDSIQIMEILWALGEEKMKVDIEAVAGGIKGFSNGEYYRDSTMSPDAYKEEDKENEGVLIYRATKDSKLHLQVTCYDDIMIPYGFDTYRKSFVKVKKKYPDLNEVDFYSGMRARQTATKWIEVLKVTAGLWIEDAELRNRIMKNLSGLKVKKVSFKNGQIKAKVPEILSPSAN